MSASLNHIRKLKVLLKNEQRRKGCIEKEMAKYGFFAFDSATIRYAISLFGRLPAKRRRTVFRIGRAALKKNQQISFYKICDHLNIDPNYDLRLIPTTLEVKRFDHKARMKKLVKDIQNAGFNEMHIFDEVCYELRREERDKKLLAKGGNRPKGVVEKDDGYQELIENL